MRLRSTDRHQFEPRLRRSLENEVPDGGFDCHSLADPHEELLYIAREAWM
jgi:hypothetical protein